MSAIGLRVRSADGTLRLDLTDKLPKVFGYFETGTSGGSITVQLPIAGEVFWVQVLAGPATASAKRAAVVHTGNGTFTWAFSFTSGMGNYAVNTRVYYGIY